MNDMTDNLRSGLAELAQDARAVDLRDRALRASRRLAVGRAVTAALVTGVAAGLVTTTVAVALPSQQESSPIGPASPPVASTPTGPSASAHAESTRPAPERRPSTDPAAEPTAESQAPPADPEIPAAAMLQQEDLGPGSQLSEDTVQHHGSLSMLMAYCGQAGDGGETSDERLLAFESGVDGLVGQQEVYRYAGDGAAKVLDSLRGSLPQCQRVAVQGNPEYLSELTVVREDFVADDSLLVDEVYTTPEETIDRYHVAIRQGDLYAYLLLETDSEDRAIEIATAAAQRLCEATPDC